MGLKYEPASEPLHISVKYLFDRNQWVVPTARLPHMNIPATKLTPAN